MTASVASAWTDSAAPPNVVEPNDASRATSRPFGPSDHADRSTAASTTPPGSVPLSPIARNQIPASDAVGRPAISKYSSVSAPCWSTRISERRSAWVGASAASPAEDPASPAVATVSSATVAVAASAAVASPFLIPNLLAAEPPAFPCAARK